MRELAQAIGMAEGTLYTQMRGHRPLSWSAVRLIARELEVDVAELAGPAGED